MGNRLHKIKDWIRNSTRLKDQLLYIVEPADWVIKWYGLELTRSLNENKLIIADVRITCRGIKNKIIHFGSKNTIFNSQGIQKIDPSNKTILTWFHIVTDDQKNFFIDQLNKQVNFFHTSANITKKGLIELGVPEEKIKVIPLGVNLNHFKPFDCSKRQLIKKRMGLPRDMIIIGSFQKDGVGWGQGLKPKIIKGPDIFCDVVEKLARKYPVFVLLTGPARGYVKKRLEMAEIPYYHKFLKNYLDIVDYYNLLDLYLITSRSEGGPRGLLECWATGVPVVSTNVGMVPDITQNNDNILLTNNFVSDQIANLCIKIISNGDLKIKLIKNGFSSVKKYSWEKIANRYYQEIYSKFL